MQGRVAGGLMYSFGTRQLRDQGLARALSVFDCLVDDVDFD